MKISFPKKVKISGIAYSVNFVDGIEDKDDQNAYVFGEINYVDSEILINTGASVKKQEQTFLHEITHGIFHAIGYNADEQLVQSFSSVLHQVLTDMTLEE